MLIAYVVVLGLIAVCWFDLTFKPALLITAVVLTWVALEPSRWLAALSH